MISGIVSLVLLFAFIAGTAWAYSSKRHEEFGMAAQIPLESDDEVLP
jgi:cbb3-type cytochrome oxidase subunit 3